MIWRQKLMNGMLTSMIQSTTGFTKGWVCSHSRRYEKEVLKLFVVLDEIDAHLFKHRFLCGETLTESDIRLFVTLLRFDPVYVGHFKCNLNRIKDYTFYQITFNVRHVYDIEDTIRMDHIKQHYYLSHPMINPSGIVPMGLWINRLFVISYFYIFQCYLFCELNLHGLVGRSNVY